jgi:GT2 family glycosyltransferase
MLSVIIITYNRKNELKECIESIFNQTILPDEIIVIDNNSNDGTEELFLSGEISHPIIKYFKLNKNLGVAGGRNYGISKTQGDILIFIDDDAIIEPEDAFEKVISKFNEDKDLGVCAFKIVNFYTKKIMPEEFPHKDKSLDPNKEFETSYFIGAGHAIKKEVFEKCGLYPEDFFYGMEELDLSFRILDKGYKIIYYPAVIVWHKKSPYGRITNEEKWIYTLRNRMCISYKYLPIKDFIISSIIWFAKVAIRSKSIIIPMLGFKKFLKTRYNITRNPVKKETLRKIKELRGRIWH